MEDVIFQLNKYHQIESKPFTGLETSYKETKYFNETGTLILPKENILGQRIDTRHDPETGKYKQIITNDTFAYVCLGDVLKRFLELPGVWKEIINYVPSTNGILKDFHDGEHYNNNPFLSSQNTITLGLYNDDMETVNPLGSHTSVHKLGFLYLIVKNLPPKFNSCLKNCHLLQVYYSEDRKKYGFDTLLQHMVNELKHLEQNGIDIVIDGTTRNVKVTIGQISGFLQERILNVQRRIAKQTRGMEGSKARRNLLNSTKAASPLNKGKGLNIRGNNESNNNKNYLYENC